MIGVQYRPRASPQHLARCFNTSFYVTFSDGPITLHPTASRCHALCWNLSRGRAATREHLQWAIFSFISFISSFICLVNLHSKLYITFIHSCRAIERHCCVFWCKILGSWCQDQMTFQPFKVVNESSFQRLRPAGGSSRCKNRCGQERLEPRLPNPTLEHTRKLSIGPMIAPMQIRCRLALSPAVFMWSCQISLTVAA